MPQPDNSFAFNERGPLFTQGSNTLQSFFKLFPRELVEALCLAIEFYPMDYAIAAGAYHYFPFDNEIAVESCGKTFPSLIV